MSHSRLASPSATIATLDRHGLRMRKSLGQHFLIDDNIVGRILDLASVAPGEPVLEIGPGIGTLTDALLASGAAVIAVEYDRRLLPALEALRAERADLRIVHGDAVSVPVTPPSRGEPGGSWWRICRTQWPLQSCSGSSRACRPQSVRS